MVFVKQLSNEKYYVNNTLLSLLLYKVISLLLRILIANFEKQKPLNQKYTTLNLMMICSGLTVERWTYASSGLVGSVVEFFSLGLTIRPIYYLIAC